MSLRLFADQCVPRSVIESLRLGGHEVLVLVDHLPPDAPDRAVLARAQALEAVLLSLNGDFADITTYPPSSHKGVITLQVRNHPELLPEMMARLAEYLSNHLDMDHYQGRLILVEVHRIRVRR